MYAQTREHEDAKASIDHRASREEFLSAFGEQVELLARQEALQKELEAVGEDMEAMTRILDELDSLNSKVGHWSKHVVRPPHAAAHDCVVD